MRKTVKFPDGSEVCALGIGTWHMGENPACRQDEIKAIRKSVELGMEVVDTAEMYANEELVGEALSGIRDNVFLVGKVLPSNASHQGTRNACERSLRKLRTDHFDLYLLHWSGSYPIEDTVKALTELQEEGKIGSWGVSNMDVEEMEDFFSFREGRACATDQVLYNLAARGPEYDLIPWCVRYNIPIMAYSPILQGQLLRNPIIRRIAEEKGATPSQVSLAWTMRNGYTLSIPKSGNPSHVEENFGALSITLSASELSLLDKTFPAPLSKVPLEMI